MNGRSGKPITYSEIPRSVSTNLKTAMYIRRHDVNKWFAEHFMEDRDNPDKPLPELTQDFGSMSTTQLFRSMKKRGYGLESDYTSGEVSHSSPEAIDQGMSIYFVGSLG